MTPIPVGDELAPIAIFGFNRPSHLLRCINSLAKNPEAFRSKIYVFIDGPRNQMDFESVNETQKVIESYSKLRFELIKTRKANLGLAGSLIDGIDLVINEHGKIIVLEDDLVVSSGFLKFMNSGLEKYETDLKVASIQGCNYFYQPMKEEAFFLKGADCWGWGTWANRWRDVNWNATELIQEIKDRNIEKEFNLNGSYNYLDILVNFERGRNSSWAVRWHASMYLQDKVSLYPAHSLVSNLGADGTGSNMGSTGVALGNTNGEANEVLPESVTESIPALNALIEYFTSGLGKVDLKSKLIYRLRYRLHYFRNRKIRNSN
jgi:hypothetical protein